MEFSAETSRLRKILSFSKKSLNCSKETSSDMLEVLLDTHSPGSVRLVGQALYQIHETPSKNDFCLIITPSPLLWNLAKFGLEMSTFSGRYSVSIIWVPRHFPGNRKAANLSWFNEESCCQTPFGQTYRSLRHGKTCAATKRLLSGLLVF